MYIREGKGDNMAPRRKAPAKRKTAARKKPSGSGKGRAKAAGSVFRGDTAVEAAARPNSGKTPFYVLAIMILLTAVVLLVNIIYSGKGSILSSLSLNKKNEPKADVVKKEVRADAERGGNKEKSPRNEETKESESKKIAEIKVPEKAVKIYLIRFNEKTEKISLVPVARKVKSESPVLETLKELIKGPSVTEKGKGLLSAVPSNLRIRDVRITDRTAVIDFNSAIEQNANGSILLGRIDQIVYTATQFDNITGVQIKINGRTKKFLGSDGLAISGPIQRRGR
jgi:spore germination protein GerM